MEPALLLCDAFYTSRGPNVVYTQPPGQSPSFTRNWATKMGPWPLNCALGNTLFRWWGAMSYGFPNRMQGFLQARRSAGDGCQLLALSARHRAEYFSATYHQLSVRAFRLVASSGSGCGQQICGVDLHLVGRSDPVSP